MSSASQEKLIRVLHVDDDTDHLLVSKRSLEKCDSAIQVVSISSPEEALQKAESFDCVVSDYQMPGMNGIEFARRIREKMDIPIIIYTGKGSEEVASSAFEAGVDDYLRKEFERSHYQVLAKRIRIAVEKHRAEEELRDSEKKYRTFLDMSKDAVFVLDQDRYLYVNQSAAELLGFSDPQELIGEDPFEFVAPEDREMVREMTAGRHRGDERPSRYEFKLVRKDGTIVTVEIQASLIEYDGKPASLAINRDITERKRMEEELRDFGEHYRTLFDSISDNILLINPHDYTIISTNQSALRQLNMNEESVVGRLCYEVTHHRTSPCEAPHDPCPVMEMRETGRSITVEHIHFDRDGNPYWSEVSVNPVKDAEGNIIEMLHISRDISERKRFEKELRESEVRERRGTT